MTTLPPEIMHQVLLDIVQLTEQRDQHSLELSLLQAFKSMFPDVSHQMLAFSEPATCKVKHASQPSHDLPEPVREHFKACQESEEISQIAVGNLRYLCANLTIDPRSPPLVLVLWRGSWLADDIRLMLGMVHVYKNFTRILFDGEKDTLTGLHNRKLLERKLGEITAAHLNRRRGQDQAVAGEYLAMLDLDRFKNINDTYGHLIGDEVLIIMASILQDSLRDTDMCFRYGGEEFIVLLSNATDEQADMVFERIRRNVEDRDFPQVGKVTLSIGYSHIDCRLRPAQQTIEEADRALYFSKGNGRNQVNSFQTLEQAKLLGTPQKEGSMELF